MFQLTRRLFVGLACLFVLAATPAWTQNGRDDRDVWAQLQGDIPADPAVLFGTLPNGMRYAIQHHATPPGQVSMRLAVRAGSMHERIGQEGIAHFLEHMAFRGSRQLPDGEAMHALERLGVRAGADSNAFTGAQNTVYVLDLPRNDAASMDYGLLVFRQTASELLFDPALVEAERGVVKSEAASSRGAYVERRRLLDYATAGNHQATHPTIGEDDVLNTVKAPELRAFYDAWYRPERTTLVIVGDIDPAAVEAKIKAAFSDWRGQGEAGRDPPPARPQDNGGEVVSLDFPGLRENTLNLLWNEPYSGFDNSNAGYRRRMIEATAGAILRQRIHNENYDAGTVFGRVNGPERVFVPGVSRSASLEIENVQDVKRTMDIVMRVLRQAVSYGVTQDEIDRMIAAQIEGRRTLVARAGARLSPKIADEIVESATEGFAHPSPDQLLQRFEVAMAGVTVEQVNAALRSMFDPSKPAVIYAGPQSPPGGERGLQNMVNQARNQTVRAYAPPTVKPWPYTNFGTPGTVTSRRVDPASGAVMVRFANNVRLTIKQTTFVRNDIQIKVRFGNGVLDLPRDQVTAAHMALVLLAGGGLRDLTSRDMVDTLSSTAVWVYPDISEDAFELTNFNREGEGLGTRPDRLELQLQLMAATIVRAGLRPDYWDANMASEAQQDGSSVRSPQALYDRIAGFLLHGGDRRWAMTTADQRAAWRPRDAINFLQPILESGPIEVIIVGDIDPDQAIALVARNFGALPTRRDAGADPASRAVRFPRGDRNITTVPHQGGEDLALAAIHWPTTDIYGSFRDSEATYVLADIMRARLFESVRATDGASYSPQAGAHFSATLPGYGFITLQAITRPQNADAMFLAFETLAANLATTPVSRDELNRAVTPRIESSLRQVQTNTWWLSALSGAQTDHRLLDMLLASPANLESLTPADIQASAQRWLSPDRAVRIAVAPGDPMVRGVAPTAGPRVAQPAPPPPTDRDRSVLRDNGSDKNKGGKSAIEGQGKVP